MINVLRLKAKDTFIAFDGKGQEFQAEIVKVEKKAISVHFTPKSTSEQPPVLNIHLVQALAKVDKMDYIIQKATELGVNQITPIITDHVEIKLNESRKITKLHHWQQIIISACEQCGRNHLPIMNPIDEFYRVVSKAPKPIFLLHPQGENSLPKIHLNSQDITLLIGPEGGFSENELAYCLKQNITDIKMGTRVLRTETAGIAAISAIQTLWGDFR